MNEADTLTEVNAALRAIQDARRFGLSVETDGAEIRVHGPRTSVAMELAQAVIRYQSAATALLLTGADRERACRMLELARWSRQQHLAHRPPPSIP